MPLPILIYAKRPPVPTTVVKSWQSSVFVPPPSGKPLFVLEPSNDLLRQQKQKQKRPPFYSTSEYLVDNHRNHLELSNNFEFSNLFQYHLHILQRVIVPAFTLCH